MVDGFNGLRFDRVVGGNYQYGDVRYMSSSGSHGRECFVARSVQEYDLLAVDGHFGSTDVLSYSA